MNPPKVIVVGFDGSPDAEAAVRWAAGLAAALGAELRVVHAAGLLEHAGMATHVAAHEERARQLAVGAGMDPALVVWRVADGDPVSVLRREAQDGGAELLVVGSRGSAARHGVPLGSTSLELVERATLPVVVVPIVGQSVPFSPR